MDLKKEIPTEAPFLEIRSFNSDDFAVVNKKIEPLNDGELLIHAAAAPINQLDILKIKGVIPGIKLPFTPGSECSGIVVDGKGPHAKDYIGKKVSAFNFRGCFSEYVTVRYQDAIILDDNADLEQAAYGFVNPITSTGLVEVAEFHGTKALINTAGNSAIGKSVLAVCKEKGIEYIPVIKGQRDYSDLTSLGVKHVLDTEDPEFENKLGETIKNLNINVALDCLGGDLIGKILRTLPKRGMLVNYGSMASNLIGDIDATEFRFNDKLLRGYTFFDWIQGQHEVDRRKTYDFVRKNMNHLFKVQVAGKVNLVDFKDAYKQVAAGKTNGKILVQLSKLLK
jgi:NADPH:quinone reductase-like Zn-dependent oxidoreductase